MIFYQVMFFTEIFQNQKPKLLIFFEHIHPLAKPLLVLYLWTWNSITGTHVHNWGNFAT